MRCKKSLPTMSFTDDPQPSVSGFLRFDHVGTPIVSEQTLPDPGRGLQFGRSRTLIPVNPPAFKALLFPGWRIPDSAGFR